MASSLLAGLTRVTQGLRQMTITQSVCQTKKMNVFFECNRSLYLQTCLYRARRGTRERKLKVLKKKKAQKAAKRIRESLQRMQLQKKQRADSEESRRVNDENRPFCTDDVWFAKMFKLRVFSFEEAINAHREVHRPAMYNDPNCAINAYVELDMTTDKKTKFFEGFVNVVPVKYPYAHREDRSVLVFCKEREQMDLALEAGASVAGGLDVVKGVKRGKITLPDFQFVIAHPNIMHDLVAIRGLLRQKFPEIEKGTLGNDLVDMISNIKTGIKYEAKKDEFDQSYGWIEVQIGHLDSDMQHLKENLISLLTDIRIRGPKRTKATGDYRFMTRCYLTTPTHQEKILIPMDDYLEPEQIFDSDDEDDEVAAAIPAPAS